MGATSLARVSRNPLVLVTFLPFQFAYSTRNTRYFWLQVYISSDSARVMCPRSPSLWGENVHVYVWDLTHHCVQVPLSVKNTSSLVCFSRSLDPAVAIVTVVELDSVGCKFVFIPEDKVSPVLIGCYRAHASGITRARLS